MKVSVLTLFPELYKPFLETSLIGRAQEQGLISTDVQSFFSFCPPKERLDAPTFGPGVGVVLRPDIVEKAIETQEEHHGKALKIFFSPQGKKLTQTDIPKLAQKVQEAGHLMLVASRYEGMDERVERYYADDLVSIGDIVLMGGDLPAMVLLEAVLRYIPGIVGKPESVAKDSFTGPFVDYPHYTVPLLWKGMQVPEILRSGNHALIEQWREEQAIRRSVLEHFAWVRSFTLTKKQRAKVGAEIPPHYVALMHTDIILGDKDRIGETSVTSIDIHDIARSSATYGLKNYFIVTPLIDQQRIVQKLLDFWQTGYGIEYNIQRHEAVKRVHLAPSLDDVVQRIEQKEGKTPILVATSAKQSEHGQQITYHDQKKVWKLNSPVLFLLGTGQGMSSPLLNRCDFLLMPIEGFSDFNHLSVRSAAAVIFDRWLGINPKSLDC